MRNAASQQIKGVAFPSAVRPNPSLEARPNGRPAAPGLRYAVHFLSPGAAVLPLAPPQLER